MYILHDAQKTSRDRVLWNETRNLVSGVDDAWFEMFATARDQAELKRQSGHDARGRKNTKPVLQYTLSWAISETPLSAHMRETVSSSLNMLGLSEHQAVIAAHCDKKHLHVHIVVNTIHPETGMTAPLKYTKERLSRWAEEYEREHGIHCRQRIENNRERARIIEQKAKDGSAVLMLGGLQSPVRARPYVPVKYRGPNRKEWFARKELKDRMSRLRAEMDPAHKAELGSLWEKQQAARFVLDRNTDAAEERASQHLKQEFKPRWRALYREQKRELNYVAGANIFERAVFVFSQRERLGLRQPLSFKSAVSLITNPGKLLDRLERTQKQERRNLGQVQHAGLRVFADRIWADHRTRMDKLIAEQAHERRSMRDQHHARTRGISLHLAKASLSAERQAANDRGRAQKIKEDMIKWRRKNDGRDFGREM